MADSTITVSAFGALDSDAQAAMIAGGVSIVPDTAANEPKQKDRKTETAAKVRNLDPVSVESGIDGLHYEVAPVTRGGTMLKSPRLYVVKPPSKGGKAYTERSFTRDMIEDLVKRADEVGLAFDQVAKQAGMVEVSA